MARRIDLNADLGESEAPEDIARDIAIMDVVTSANIACGGHAGNDATMKAMLEAAAKRGVAAGGHPSYPDRKNFGRVSMEMRGDELRREISDQIGALASIAEHLDIALSHIKPHGALYNDMADDAKLTAKLFDASLNSIPDIPMVGLAGSEVKDVADELRLPFIPEAFIDRRYTPNGRLVPRSEVGAVIESNEERIAQALSIARDGKVTASGGKIISINAHTLCLHSDSDGALETARAVRRALEDAGIEIAAPT